MGQEISFTLDSIHQLPGKDHEKLEAYHKLFDLHKKNKDYTQLGSDAHQVGRWLFYKEKKWKEALSVTEIAIDARKKADPFNPEMLKRSYHNHSLFNIINGRHSEGIKSLKKLLAVKGSDYNHDKAYDLIGNSYRILGDPHQALEYQLLAFKYYDPVKDKRYIISNHINTAISYKNIGDPKSYDQAIIHLLAADSLNSTMEKYSIHEDYAINNNLGDMYFQQQQEETESINKSIIRFEKAMVLAEKMNNTRNLAQVNFNLGMIYSESDPVLAQDFFEKASSYAKNNRRAAYLIPKIYRGLGQAAFGQENYSETHEYFRKAFSVYFNKEIQDSNWLPSKQELELTYFRDKSVFLELLKLKALAYLEQAKKENDTISYQNAIRTVKTADVFTDQVMKENLSYRSKLTWRSSTSQMYAIGLEACYQLNDIETAFFFMEKNKALLLTQEVIKNNINFPGDILQRKKRLENNVIRQQRRFTNASDTKKDSISAVVLAQKEMLQQFKDSLSSIYPEYSNTTVNPKILSLTSVKPTTDEAIIQYIIAESIALTVPQTFGIAITDNDTHFFKVNNPKKLLDNIYSLRKQLSQPFQTPTDISNYRNQAYRLYNQLFPEEVQKLLKHKKVTIVPDRQLSFIPFEALVTEKDTGTYLIENTEINYVYSLSFQKENATINRQHENEFLGVAPINFSNGLATLSKSKNEIDTAQTYYKGSLLLNEQAIKENFTEQIGNYKILHLATHADASDSIAPWIAFHDTKLTVDEINVSKTNAELVVLSACNTSLGEITHGEGVLSLARGFFVSGANTVIPSLWSTNDKTTATITSNFYKNLSDGKTKSEALRLAKLDYLKSNTDAEASPYYWAPLILIGDTTTLLPATNYWIIFVGITAIILIFLIFYFMIYKKKQKILKKC